MCLQMFVTCSLTWTWTPLVDSLACFTERKQNTDFFFLFAVHVSVMSIHIRFPLSGLWYVWFLKKSDGKYSTTFLPWWEKTPDMFVCKSDVMSGHMHTVLLGMCFYLGMCPRLGMLESWK